MSLLGSELEGSPASARKNSAVRRPLASLVDDHKLRAAYSSVLHAFVPRSSSTPTLFDALADGLTLALLVEAVTGCRLLDGRTATATPKNAVQARNNLTAALTFLRKNNVDTTCTADNLTERNAAAGLGLLEAIYSHYLLEDGPSGLLSWASTLVGSPCDVCGCWQDGRLLYSLVASLPHTDMAPGLELQPSATPATLLGDAQDYATMWYQVPRLVTSSDLEAGTAEPQVLLLYLAMLRHVARNNGRLVPEMNWGPLSAPNSGLDEKRKSMIEEKWVRQQRKAFTLWVGSHLAQRQVVLTGRLEDAMADGSTLLHLIEILAVKRLLGGRWQRRKPGNKFEVIGNLAAAIKFIEENGGINLGITQAEHLYDKNTKLVFGLVFQLIKRFQIGSGCGSQPELLEWCQRTCQPLGISVANFSAAWQDGVAFAAVLNALLKRDKRPTIDTDVPPVALMETVFDQAYTIYEIPKLLDAEDTASSPPDDKSVMTYVSYFLKEDLHPLAQRQPPRCESPAAVDRPDSPVPTIVSPDCFTLPQQEHTTATTTTTTATTPCAPSRPASPPDNTTPTTQTSPPAHTPTTHGHYDEITVCTIPAPSPSPTSTAIAPVDHECTTSPVYREDTPLQPPVDQEVQDVQEEVHTQLENEPTPIAPVESNLALASTNDVEIACVITPIETTVCEQTSTHADAPISTDVWVPEPTPDQEPIKCEVATDADWPLQPLEMEHIAGVIADELISAAIAYIQETCTNEFSLTPMYVQSTFLSDSTQTRDYSAHVSTQPPTTNIDTDTTPVASPSTLTPTTTKTPPIDLSILDAGVGDTCASTQPAPTTRTTHQNHLSHTPRVVMVDKETQTDTVPYLSTGLDAAYALVGAVQATAIVCVAAADYLADQAPPTIASYLPGGEQTTTPTRNPKEGRRKEDGWPWYWWLAAGVVVYTVYRRCTRHGAPQVQAGPAR